MPATDEPRQASSSLIRRVEEASLNGWPALRILLLDGWLLGLSEGHTRRANSVHPLAHGDRDPHAKIISCEQIYAAHGLPALFCIRSFTPPDLSRALDERGYAPPEDETHVLYRDLTPGGTAMPGDVEFNQTSPTEMWLATLARLHGQSERDRATYRRILGQLAIPAAFAAVPGSGGEQAALAFGAVHDGVICINSVVTDPGQRRKGHARKAVDALLAWAARDAGATGACLSVVGSNLPARTLYGSLGFRDEVYRYHYRRRAP